MSKVQRVSAFRSAIEKVEEAKNTILINAIRHQKAVAGIILTASHNPFTDVGIKVNDHTGAPALEDIVKGGTYAHVE